MVQILGLEGVDQVINDSYLRIAPLMSYLSVQHVIIIEKYFSTSTLEEKEDRFNQRCSVLPTVQEESVTF